MEPQKTKEALDNALKPLIKETPQMKCSQGKTITKVCINQACKNKGLRCDDAQCKSCGDLIHKGCPSSSFNDITDVINKKVGIYKDLFIQMAYIQENVIMQQMRKTREQFIQIFVEEEIKKENIGMVGKVYNDKNIDGLMGKDFSIMKKQVNAQLNRQSSLFQDKITTYDYGILQNTDQMDKLRKRLFSTFSVLMYSRVLSLKGKVTEDASYICQQLNYPKQIQLLFRGSQHNFQIQKFHKYCDNIPNTLIIGRTYNCTTIAGFTPLPWQMGKWSISQDKEMRTFVLQLDSKIKITPIDISRSQITQTGQDAIGFGTTFEIVNGCNNREVYTSYPAYFKPIGRQYKTKADALFEFIGSYQPYYKIVQYEVYKIIY